MLALAILRVVFGDQWRFGWWRSLPHIAQRLERRTPKPRNLVVTASELLGGTRSYVHDAVMVRASRLVNDLDLGALFPARRALIGAAIAAIAFTLVLMRPAVASRVIEVMPFGASGPSVRRVYVSVTPPAYSGLPKTTTIDPSRIEALAASRIEISVEATAASVELEMLDGKQDMGREGDNYTASLNATTDGFLAIEPRDSAGRAGARQLIGLLVTPDASPRVTLTAPGRDLFFATVPDTLSVAINAADDLALSSLVLKYTTVSGSGERFTFTEREVPLTVVSQNARHGLREGPGTSTSSA